MQREEQMCSFGIFLYVLLVTFWKDSSNTHSIADLKQNVIWLALLNASPLSSTHLAVCNIWLWCLVCCVCFTRYRLLFHLCTVVRTALQCKACARRLGCVRCSSCGLRLEPWKTKQGMSDVSPCIHKEASLEKQDVYVSVTRIKSIF